MTQAGAERPVLLYRVDRGAWRAVWPVAVVLAGQPGAAWPGYLWTADTSLDAWAAVARETVSSPAVRS